ncbi:MAG: hypothetical protein CFE24_00195 [Flavobacterium sp. BFFFF2]|nr:MAG: hypothetical protein CFE24_00195 [Flavobacterium sp. BFFFF2]
MPARICSHKFFKPQKIAKPMIYRGDPRPKVELYGAKRNKSPVGFKYTSFSLCKQTVKTF